MNDGREMQVPDEVARTLSELKDSLKEMNKSQNDIRESQIRMEGTITANADKTTYEISMVNERVGGLDRRVTLIEQQRSETQKTVKDKLIGKVIDILLFCSAIFALSKLM